MTKPKIALVAARFQSKTGSPTYQNRQVDIEAVLLAGGLPVLLPAAIPLEEIPVLTAQFDGFYLTGGGDLDPLLYGENNHERIYGLNPERDAFELALIQEVVAQDKPLLAVCRGMQALNVACGGTLYVDIASQLPSAEKHDWWPTYRRNKLVHNVTVSRTSYLARILGEVELRTNSLHHQSVNKVADELKKVAYALDGVVEAIEHLDKRFVIGVQWHPEWLQNQQPMRKLYKAFIENC